MNFASFSAEGYYCDYSTTSICCGLVGQPAVRRLDEL